MNGSHATWLFSNQVSVKDYICRCPGTCRLYGRKERELPSNRRRTFVSEEKDDFGKKNGKRSGTILSSYNCVKLPTVKVVYTRRPKLPRLEKNERVERLGGASTVERNTRDEVIDRGDIKRNERMQATPVSIIRSPVMYYALYGTLAAAVVRIVVAATSVNGRQVTENGERLEYEKSSHVPDVTYRIATEDDVHSSAPYETEAIVRPVSYSYFSANIRDAFKSESVAKSPVEARPPSRKAPLDFLPGSHVEEVAPQLPSKVIIPILTDNVRQQSHLAPYQEESGTLPPVSGRTVRFPLNTVLPGNSLGFDPKPYPRLVQAVNRFSDLTPSRKPNEGVVTHDAVTPATRDVLTTAGRTWNTNRAPYGGGGSLPYEEFTETAYDTRGDRGSLSERTHWLPVRQGFDEYPAETHLPFKTGRGEGGAHYGSERGENQEDDHHTTKGGKGEKAYNKDSQYHKEGKGYHDKERDSSDAQENLKKEKKYHKDEEFYGEHHKTEKGGKGKKYGEGGKHKKGHTTHGEHNIIKKDEFIKNTKFYDEDHGGGEHEEHGEFYGQHEEKQGGNKEGKDKESQYEKENVEKNRSHDKGHVEEEQRSRDAGSGHEKHYEREEEYGGKRGGHTFKKWGSTIGDHH